MWFRYISISLLKWITVNVLTLVMLFYILPDSWRGYALAAPMWIMIFAVSAAFAFWALLKKSPRWKDVLKLLGVWLLVMLVMQNAYEFYIFGRAFFVWRSPEATLAYLIEILGVIVGAILVRWYLERKAKGIIAG